MSTTFFLTVILSTVNTFNPATGESTLPEDCPAIKCMTFEDIQPDGMLKARAELAFRHLQEDYFQWDNISKVNYEPFPGDAIGRDLNALTLLCQALHQEAPANLQAIVTSAPLLHNSDGYLGPLLPESRANEDTIAGHNAYLYGWCEYARWTQDPKSLDYIKTMAANLFVPCQKAISLYRQDSPEAAQVNWVLSGGDIGQLFTILDSLTRAYALAPSPEFQTMIETVIARYQSLDLIKISAQTHATLSAATGILRWYELHRRPEDLAFAERLYQQYRDQAMTETYENYNWFNRPEWTEACAVVDSFILTSNLWRLTGKINYLEDAHLILFNGFLPGQMRQGGFGTGPCVGANGICRTKEHFEAPFCCSMRGGEGLSRAIQYSYFLDGDTVFLAFYSDNTALLRFSDGTCKLHQTTGYPHEGTIRLEVLESQVMKEKCLRFFVPSWAEKESLQVTIDGDKVIPQMKGSFAEVKGKPSTGMVIEITFKQTSGPQPSLHPDRWPGAKRYFRGPLLLGSNTQDASEPLIPVLDLLDPFKGTFGEPYVFFTEGETSPSAQAQPVTPQGDLSRQAHIFRCDAPADKVPEAVAPLFTTFGFNRAMALCGFLWDTPQEVSQVVLQWPEGSVMPAATNVVLQWSTDGEINTAPAPGIIGNGRQWVYRISKDGQATQLANLVLSIKDPTWKPEFAAVPDVQVLNQP